MFIQRAFQKYKDFKSATAAAASVAGAHPPRRPSSAPTPHRSRSLWLPVEQPDADTDSASDSDSDSDSDSSLGTKSIFISFHFVACGVN